jgi:hypothetical protein
LALVVGGTKRLDITNAGLARYHSVDLGANLELGTRQLVRQTTGGTLTAAMVNTCQAVSANVTVNNGVFSAGDCLCVYNNSGSSIQITKGTITNLRLAGTTSDASRTLAARAFATIWFNSATEAVVMGPGVT